MPISFYICTHVPFIVSLLCHLKIYFVLSFYFLSNNKPLSNISSPPSPHLQVHRAAKTGEMEAEGLDGDDPAEYRLAEPPPPGHDVLGQQEQMKRPPDAKCPVCARSIACTRFAPHLEKCVGLGRNSSRLASKRIASNQRETNYGLSEEEEEEWTGERKKKKRDKLSPRRNKVGWW